MGKRKIFKIVFVILSIFLCVVFYELLGICVPASSIVRKKGSCKTRSQAAGCSMA